MPEPLPGPLPVVLAAGDGGSAFGLLLPLLLVGAFFLLLVRPQRQRQRAIAALQATLSVGQEVITTAGQYGRVSAVTDDTVTLEIADGVHSRFARGAVARVLSGQPPFADGGPGAPSELPPEDQPPRP